MRAIVHGAYMLHNLLTGLLCRDADSYTRPGLHRLRAGPSQLLAGGQDLLRFRRPDLARAVVELGTRLGDGGFWRSSTPVGWAVRHCSRAAAAQWLRALDRQLRALVGAWHGDVASLSEFGTQSVAGGLLGTGRRRVAIGPGGRASRGERTGLRLGQLYLRGRLDPKGQARYRRVAARLLYVRHACVGGTADQARGFLGNPSRGGADRRRTGDRATTTGHTTAQSLHLGRRGGGIRERVIRAMELLSLRSWPC